MSLYLTVCKKRTDLSEKRLNVLTQQQTLRTKNEKKDKGQEAIVGKPQKKVQKKQVEELPVTFARMLDT